LLTEFARSIEKLLTMKNLAGLDGSTPWLNVSHQANQSTGMLKTKSIVMITTILCSPFDEKWFLISEKKQLRL
jgi:hypothetical protein